MRKFKLTLWCEISNVSMTCLRVKLMILLMASFVVILWRLTCENAIEFAHNLLYKLYLILSILGMYIDVNFFRLAHEQLLTRVQTI